MFESYFGFMQCPAFSTSAAGKQESHQYKHLLQPMRRGRTIPACLLYYDGTHVLQGTNLRHRYVLPRPVRPFHRLCILRLHLNVTYRSINLHYRLVQRPYLAKKAVAIFSLSFWSIRTFRQGFQPFFRCYALVI